MSQNGRRPRRGVFTLLEGAGNLASTPGQLHARTYLPTLSNHERASLHTEQGLYVSTASDAAAWLSCRSIAQQTRVLRVQPANTRLSMQKQPLNGCQSC
jgi:hypothetical protein